MLADFGVEADLVYLQLPCAVEVVEHEGGALCIDQRKAPFRQLVTLLQIQMEQVPVPCSTMFYYFLFITD